MWSSDLIRKKKGGSKIFFSCLKCTIRKLMLSRVSQLKIVQAKSFTTCAKSFTTCELKFEANKMFLSQWSMKTVRTKNKKSILNKGLGRVLKMPYADGSWLNELTD